VALLGIASLALVAGLVRPACAHSFEPALLTLREQAPGVFALTWTGSSVTDPSAGAGPLTPRLPAHCRALPTDGPAQAEERPQKSVASRMDCGPQGLRGGSVSIDGLEASPADAIIRIVWLDGNVATGVLHRSQNDFIVPDAPDSSTGSRWASFTRYFVLGTEHILIAFDPLLFVLGLMLLVHSTRALITSVMAFTLAHSVTLALATFGIVQLPAAPVHVAMALSIVLLAVEVARTETGFSTVLTATQRSPWRVAFVFGLLYGLGFAEALAGVGLPRNQIALGLFGFNLGVEAGQLAFVATLSALAVAWTHVHLPTRWMRLLPAYGMGVVTVAWTLQRLQQLWKFAS
jgi:HupE/UreJ protein